MVFYALFWIFMMSESEQVLIGILDHKCCIAAMGVKRYVTEVIGEFL